VRGRFSWVNTLITPGTASAAVVFARHGASLVKVTYAEEVPNTDLAKNRDAAYVPPKKFSARNGEPGGAT
jgi:hypothetical protein